MRMQQRHARGEAVIGNTHNSHFAVVIGNVLQQPVDGVIGVSGLVGCFGVLLIDVRRKQERAFRLEAATEVLNHEDVAICHEFFQVGRYLIWRAIRNTIRSTAQENRQRAALAYRRKNYGLQVHAIAHRDHHFLKFED